MASVSMFVEKSEPEIVFKDEPASSTFDPETRLNRFTPVRLQPSTALITPVSTKTEYAGENVFSSTPADQLDEREQMKTRLAIKHREINAAKEWLSSFPDWLHPKERSVPEVGDWIEDTEAILSHSSFPRVVLGFMGPSGSGKSSVINALLDEESLLPCNCTEACTAVAVEVAWNQLSDHNRAYRAKIKFITAAEWRAELDLLIAELMTLEPEARLHPSGDEAKVAAAKIQAVYPGLAIDELTEESAPELMNDIVVSRWLGKEIEIEIPVGKGKRFAAEISRYIDSSPKPKSSGAAFGRERPYWPLVKVVQIFTRSPVLATGLVLVDLPGSGDSNVARAMVAQGYMQQVSAICIVAEIKRAVTSSVARNLYGRGEALKRRLLRDGLLDDEHTFFVLTCTDIINNEQVIKAQGLDNLPHVAHILHEQRIKTLRLNSIIRKRDDIANAIAKHSADSNKPQRRQRAAGFLGGHISQQGTKRKLVDDEIESPVVTTSLPDHEKPQARRENFHETGRRLISKIDSEANTIKCELADIKKQLSAICIRERNSYVILRMKEDFASGLRALEEEMREEGDDEAGYTWRSSEDSIRDGIDTFCVCSKAYQSLRGKFPLEDVPIGFEALEDTSMPQLMKHCKEYTLNARERLADTFLEDLTRLRRRLRCWADNTTPDREVTRRQKRLISEAFTDHLKCLDMAVSESIESAATKLRQDSKQLSQKALKKAVPDAAKQANDIFNEWAESIKNVRTWKAICRKEGVHVSKAAGEYNWNDDLAELFSTLLDSSFGKIATQVLPELHRDYKENVQKALKHFATSLNKSCLGVTKHVLNAIQNLLFNFEGVEAEALTKIDSRFGQAINMSRILDRRVPTAIRLVMSPGYIKAHAVRGGGSFAKSRMTLQNHIRKNSKQMYENAAAQVSEGAEDIVIILKNHLEEDFKNSVKKIEEYFTKMLNTASETARPESGSAKVELQKEVLDKLGRFDSLLGEFRGTPVVTDIMDAADIKVEGEGEDETECSENGCCEDDIDLAKYERELELGDFSYEEKLDSGTNGSGDPILDSKEDLGNEHMNEN